MGNTPKNKQAGSTRVAKVILLFLWHSMKKDIRKHLKLRS